MIIPSRARSPERAVAILSVMLGAIAAAYYASLGLTLSHYDARGHLIVARRVFDSLTPGWQQIGAVWLPLPHVLNAVPVQIDAFYRSGASAVVMSVLSFALAASCIAAIVFMTTASRMAAIAAAATFALNPNVLYLQSTPMTEPLLLGVSLLAVALLMAWCGGRAPTPAVGVAFALACLTRYEAWPVTAAALALAWLSKVRAGEGWQPAARSTLRLAAFPAAAIAGFMIMSRVVVGEWFVSGGFFVPENPALGDPLTAINQVAWGAQTLSGPMLMVVGASGLAALAAVSLTNRNRSAFAVGLAPLCAAALPLLAFYNGHPYRIRYIVPLIAAQAIGVGAAVGFVDALFTRWAPRRRINGAPATIVASLVAAGPIAADLRPFDAESPMVLEAQWDRPNAAVRQSVTTCLSSAYDGETIMASMGSLGHYMQEMAAAGFRLRDFLHEGNGDVWLTALYSPLPYAGWVLIEEQAEGGDMLAARRQSNPRFLEGYSRVCEGGGVALYRRDPGAALAEKVEPGDRRNGGRSGGGAAGPVAQAP